MSTDAQTNALQLNDYEARIEAKRERDVAPVLWSS